MTNPSTPRPLPRLGDDNFIEVRTAPPEHENTPSLHARMARTTVSVSTVEAVMEAVGLPKEATVQVVAALLAAPRRVDRHALTGDGDA